MSFTETEIEEFKTEARELLETAERGLLALDSGEDFKTHFDDIFRSFHNLKGGAGMMEFTQLQAHTHELESAFMKFKTETTVPKEDISAFLRGVDIARRLLDGQPLEVATPTVVAPTLADAPADHAPSMPVSDGEFFAECEEILERVAKLAQSIDHESVHALYREVHSLKGAAHLFSYRSLGLFAHAIETCLEPVRDGLALPTPALLDLIYKSIKGIELEMQWIKGGKPDTQLASAEAVIPQEIEAVLQSYATDKKPAPVVIAPAPAAPTHASPIAPPAAKDADGDANSSIRVSVAILDKLMALMGEMVLVRNQVLQYSNRSEDREFVNLSKRLNLVTGEVQGELLKTRMQPIGNVLSKFNRVVRDLSQELKKDIALVLHGADTELDKSLLEAIKDPLTHIVRNSCDHGIETPDVRAAQGKANQGTITIRSFHEGGQIVAEISDDGKGLNREVLTRKAVEKGLLSEAEAVGLTEKEAFDLIFAPGFSTAASVTNISGRGVGMDVVRTNIERIGGTVELSSTLGRGTMIRIRLPLTLAIIPALLVKSGGSLFAIPQVKLIELLRVNQTADNRIEYLHGAPVYRLRGEILPLVDLNKALRIQDQRDKEASVNIVAVSSDHGAFGLIVDEVRDTADIVVKPLNRLFKSLQAYSGATVLGDGTVALIIDITGLGKLTQVGGMKRKTPADANKILRENQDYILVRLKSQTKHAFVLHLVNRLEEFDSRLVEWQGHQRIIRYNQTILPLISANKELGYGEDRELPARFPVIVIQRAGQLFGLIVDEILDTLSTNLEAQPGMQKQNGLYGSLNMNEELIVVAEPYEIITSAFPEQKAVRAFNTNIQSAVKRSGNKILLLDDAPFFRKAVGRILTGAGFEVVTANDGQEGLEMLRKLGDQVSLVVSDIEMPRLNGFQFAQALRQEARFADLPLIAVSSRADQGYVQRGMESGFNIYLEKLNGEALLKAIADLGLKQGYVA